MDVRQCGRATYLILFNIWALVNFLFCFRDSLRAYGIKPLNIRIPEKIVGHKATPTLRKTLPRGPSGVPWLSEHAAQEVLVERSRK